MLDNKLLLLIEYTTQLLKDNWVDFIMRGQI